jgi:hypothetical protein
MEIVYFTLGMLTMVATVLTASAVYNIVKLSKLYEWVRDINNRIESTQRDMYRIEENISSHTNRRFDNLYSEMLRRDEENSRRLDELQSHIGRLDNKKQQING